MHQIASMTYIITHKPYSFSGTPNIGDSSLKPSDFSGTPNLGEYTLNLLARDDAKHVYCIEMENIVNGKVAMPFRHAEFLREYLKSNTYYKYQNLVPYIDLICKFSRIRNHRLMRKINNVIAQHEGKKQFTFTQEMMDLDEQLENLIEEANRRMVDYSLYLNEETDEDDVEQCTNSWCLNQNQTPGKAADNIIVITDLDQKDWLVLIERQNGPGRAQAAWAGGFVDKDESFTQTAIREGDEETEVTFKCSTTGTSVCTTTTELPVIKSLDWDPRAKFVEGMENGAVVTHHRFFLRYKIDCDDRVYKWIYEDAKKFIANNEFKRCPNVHCYGLNSFGTTSIIEFKSQIWKFVSFKSGSNFANYVNKYGHHLLINLMYNDFTDEVWQVEKI